MKNLYHFIKQQWRSYRFIQNIKRQNPSCSFEKGFYIKGPIKNLQLGKKIQIQANVHFHLGGMEWCKDKGNLIIGNNSCISPQVIIYASGPGGVTIGNNFDCGPGVKIFASHTDIYQHDQHLFGKVIIGDNVVLFANVVVSPGVHIGDNSVIFASAVVNEDVPPNTVYGGVPAKFIKKIR